MILTDEKNNWSNSWRNGIFNFHHYHSITHEVLGVHSGNAKVLLGGDRGILINAEKGDVIIIPATYGTEEQLFKYWK